MAKSPIDPQLLREFADRAYNYRWKVGKAEFKAIYAIIDILEYAEKNNVDISTPQKFQNLLTKLRDLQQKLDEEAGSKYFKEHSKKSKRKEFRMGLSKKDWHDYIFADGEQVYGL